MISNIYNSILSLSCDNIILIVLVLCVISFMYYSFAYEGFSNKDACMLAKKGTMLNKQGISKLYEQNTMTMKDEINVGYNYRDMQSRDLILGDEEVNWCARLSNEELKQVEEEISNIVDSEVFLFDGPGLIDALEKKSIDDGIMYAGADSINEKYSKA